MSKALAVQPFGGGVNLTEAFLESGEYRDDLSLADVSAYVHVVRDEDGDITGTLLYVDCVAPVELIVKPTTKGTK